MAQPARTTAGTGAAESRDIELLHQLARARRALLEQIGRRIIGQHEVVDNLVAALLSGGHALLVGVPGLAKTLLVKTVAEALGLTFSRVQFTPDLMPSDITGTELLEEEHATGRRIFKFVRGPIFGNVILADEINRAPPKTQAALLQAMQEHAVTAAGLRVAPRDRAAMVLLRTPDQPATGAPLDIPGAVTVVAGLMVLARACLGGTRAVLVGSDLRKLQEAAGTLSERRYISLVPPQLDRALCHDDVTEALAGFSAVLVGGGPTEVGLVERARAAGIRVVTTYGMSETCGGCVYDGEPLHGVAVDLADDDRILIRSNTLFAGYRLRPDLTAEAVVDGRFRTQDRGSWDAGRLVVRGRTDDIVITGGHKVDLAEVEQSVQRWAADHGARGAVLGVADLVWGTTIIAVSDMPGSLADLQTVVRESLPAYAMPRELIYLDQLPWLANGKPDRSAIRSMIMSLRAEREATA